MDTKYNVFYLILTKLSIKTIQYFWEIIESLRMKKQPEISILSYSLFEKTQIQLKFSKICILTFSVSVVETSNTL